jgi:hypothetical protein
MKKFAILVSVVILTMGLVVSAFASNSQADAKALVEKAATFFKSNGKDKALQNSVNLKVFLTKEISMYLLTI